jgi:anti-sigma regulatory factor (Ser/Thr protein kinase)
MKDSAEMDSLRADGHAAEGPVAVPPAVPVAASGGAAEARRLARDRLSEWGYTGRHDDVVLVVSELVSNAIRHGWGTATIRLSGSSGRVRIEVADDSPVLPSVRQGGPDGGWGLALTERLSEHWGVERRDAGKVVWCELVPAVAGDMGGEPRRIEALPPV